MADNEISLDDDTHIRELEESESKEKSQPRRRSVVVKIPLDQITSDSTSGSPVSSKRKKELLKKSKETDHSYSKNDTRDTDKTLELIKPLPVPDNYTIRKKTPDRSEKEERSQTSKKDSPARRRSRSRERSRGRRRSTERGRSRSPSRHRSPRRRSRSPSYRRRYSPRRSWSRNSRFSRSPRRSRSPVFRRRSPPRVFRPRDRSFSRSPVRRFTPPRWRDNRFTGPPGPPDFGNRWDSRPPRPGFSPRRQGFGPDYPSNDRIMKNIVNLGVLIQLMIILYHHQSYLYLLNSTRRIMTRHLTVLKKKLKTFPRQCWHCLQRCQVLLLLQIEIYALLFHITVILLVMMRFPPWFNPLCLLFPLEGMKIYNQ